MEVKFDLLKDTIIGISHGLVKVSKDEFNNALNDFRKNDDAILYAIETNKNDKDISIAYKYIAKIINIDDDTVTISMDDVYAPLFKQFDPKKYKVTFYAATLPNSKGKYEIYNPRDLILIKNKGKETDMELLKIYDELSESISKDNR